MVDVKLTCINSIKQIALIYCIAKKNSLFKVFIVQDQSVLELQNWISVISILSAWQIQNVYTSLMKIHF